MSKKQGTLFSSAGVANRCMLRIISNDNSDPDLTAFWADMAHRLFWNVNILYEQIETQYADQSPDEGPGAQMAVSTIGAASLTAMC
jgi:hypothetical protein